MNANPRRFQDVDWQMKQRSTNCPSLRMPAKDLVHIASHSDEQKKARCGLTPLVQVAVHVGSNSNP